MFFYLFIYLLIYWGLYVCICFVCVCYFIMICLRKIYFLRLNIVFLNNYLINGGSSHCEKCQNTDRKKLHTWTLFTHCQDQNHFLDKKVLMQSLDKVSKGDRSVVPFTGLLWSRVSLLLFFFSFNLCYIKLLCC